MKSLLIQFSSTIPGRQYDAVRRRLGRKKKMNLVPLSNSERVRQKIGSHLPSCKDIWISIPQRGYIPKLVDVLFWISKKSK